MQTDEVSAIKGDQSSIFLGREPENFRIGDGLITPTAILNRHHIVTQFTQPFSNRNWEVLVCIEACHNYSSLLSFSRMAASISSRWWAT